MSNTDVLQTSSHTLSLIERLADRGGGRVSELADEMGLAPSTVHDHLQTLHEHEYVAKKGDRYVLGPIFFHLGQHVRTRDPIYHEVKKTIGTMIRDRDERVMFAVEDRDRLLILYDASREYVQREHYVGSYNYLHSTAAGKAILSELPDHRVTDVVDRWGLDAGTDQSLSDRTELDRELAAVRERGYAINEEEDEPGVHAVAVPVRNAAGAVCGALGVYGPAYQLTDYDDISTWLTDHVAALEATITENGYY
jgi:DNA-binding IclR family transcriptional regulator